MFLINHNDRPIDVFLVNGDITSVPPQVITDIGTINAAIPLPPRVVEFVPPNAKPVIPPGPAYPTFPFPGMTISGVSGVGVTEFWDGTAWVPLTVAGGGGSAVWKPYNPATPVASKDMLMVDTSVAPVTIALPLGVSGESIGFLDAKGTFVTNNLTLTSTAPDTFMGLPSPLVHSVSRTLILTSTGGDWRF